MNDPWSQKAYECFHCGGSVSCSWDRPIGYESVYYVRVIWSHHDSKMTCQSATPILKVEDLDVLIVENSPARHEWFLARLPSAVICDNPQDACRALKERRWKTLFLDFDLARGTSSRDCAQLLVKRPELWPSENLFIHSHGNPAWLQATLGNRALQTPFGRFEIHRISPRLI